MNAGMIGGIIGAICGIGGGLIGTYYSVKNTNGPLERAFMIKACAIIWIGISIFIVLMYLLPIPYRFWLWVPYSILLPLGILKFNISSAEIRETEKNL